MRCVIVLHAGSRFDPRSARYTPDGAVSSASISRPRQPRLPRVLRFEQISCFFSSSFWICVHCVAVEIYMPSVCLFPQSSALYKVQIDTASGVLGISVLTNRKGWWNEKSRSLLLPLGRRAVRQLRMNPLISPSDGAADWRP